MMTAALQQSGSPIADVTGLVRPNTDDWSIFVGDLAPDVTDAMLQSAFAQFYASVRSAKVIVDPATGRSKGYGFVRFAAEGERDKSLEMQGYTLCNRPIRVSLATARRSPSAGMPGTHPAELDPTNTTLFIGGLSAGVTEEQLRAIFIRYGEVVYTKIPQGKGCGFVQFVSRADAEAAMAEMNGQVIGSSAIRISWGRSTSRAAALQQGRPGVLGAFPAAAGGFGVSAGFPGAGLDAFGAAGGLVSVGGMAAAQPGALGGTMFNAGGGYDLTGAAGLYTSNGLSGGLPVVSAADSLMFRAQPMAAGLGGYGSQALAGMYDPMGGMDVSKLNALFMQRQQPALAGGFMRPVG